jgi:hypothetical protein
MGLFGTMLVRLTLKFSPLTINSSNQVARQDGITRVDAVMISQLPLASTDML